MSDENNRLIQDLLEKVKALLEYLEKNRGGYIHQNLGQDVQKCLEKIENLNYDGK